MPSSSAPPPLFDEFPPTSTEAWIAKIRKDLGGRDPEAVLAWDSIDGLSLSARQRREDLDDIAHVSASAPASPLTDASSPGNDWRLRQDLRHPDPEAAGALARSALDGDCTHLGLCLSPPDGIALDGPDALASLLDGLAGDATLHLDGGTAAVLGLLALQEADAEAVASVGYDPVAALATGTLSDADRAFALAGALYDDAPPTARTATVDLRPYHNAGASAVQELAYGLGALSETLHRHTDRGGALAALVPRLQVHTAVSTSYLVEIAKLRALRLLVPQVIDAFAEAVGASLTFAPSDLVVQATTSRRTETVYGPYVNMLRGTTAAMAAVLGGCDVLGVRAYDAPLRPPDHFGTRIARNVQHLLKHEAHLDLVDDPAAGAYYLEAATDQMARRAWDSFQKLERHGGMVPALREGRVQSAIGEVRTNRCRAVDNRDRVLVGTNHYPDLAETASLERSSFSCNNGTKEVIELGPAPLDVLRDRLAAGRSIPDLTATLAGSGSSDIEALPQVRVAEGIERVRRRTEQYAEAQGRPPLVLVAPIGPAGPRSARATFARNVFGVAGFDVKSPLRFEDPVEAADEVAQASPEVVVLCSADAEYPALTPALRTALANRGCAPLLMVAGTPAQMEDEVPADLFVHRHSPLRDILEAVQDRLGLPVLNEDAP